MAATSRTTSYERRTPPSALTRNCNRPDGRRGRWYRWRLGACVEWRTLFDRAWHDDVTPLPFVVSRKNGRLPYEVEILTTRLSNAQHDSHYLKERTFLVVNRGRPREPRRKSIAPFGCCTERLCTVEYRLVGRSTIRAHLPARHCPSWEAPERTKGCVRSDCQSVVHPPCWSVGSW